MNNFYKILNTHKSLKCDVLVVGCGPGGSGAAYGAASRGLNTIVIEKREHLGAPVKCGEVMDPSLLSTFNITIDPSIIKAKQDGTIFWINNDVKAENCSPLWHSVSIDRGMLDKFFAYNAAKHGAKIIVGAELKDIEFDGDNASVAIVAINRGEIQIIPKIIIAADGTYSTVGRLQGTARPKKSEIGITASFEMCNVDLYDSNKVQMFFNEFTMGGYGYIIPKSENSANIGLGKLGIDDHPWDSLYTFLDENNIVNSQIEDASIMEIKVGHTPITGPKLTINKGNVMYVGDAAGQNLSHVGEGAIPSQVCGRCAGKVAAEAIKNNNILSLNNYGLELSNTIGPMLNECAKIRDGIFDILTYDLSIYDKLFLTGLFVGEIIPIKYFNEILDSFRNNNLYDTMDYIDDIIKKERFSNQISITKYNEFKDKIIVQ